MFVRNLFFSNRQIATERISIKHDKRIQLKNIMIQATDHKLKWCELCLSWLPLPVFWVEGFFVNGLWQLGKPQYITAILNLKKVNVWAKIDIFEAQSL